MICLYVYACMIHIHLFPGGEWCWYPPRYYGCAFDTRRRGVRKSAKWFCPSLLDALNLFTCSGGQDWTLKRGRMVKIKFRIRRLSFITTWFCFPGWSWPSWSSNLVLLVVLTPCFDFCRWVMSYISAIPSPFRSFAIFLHICCSLYLMPSMMYDDVCISCFGGSFAGTGRQWMIQIWGWRQPKSATTCESTAKPSKSATKTYDSATRRHSQTHFEQPSQQKFVLTGPFWKASAGIAQMLCACFIVFVFHLRERPLTRLQWISS